MTFLETNQDILAFTREKGGEKLLFIFNLRRGPQTVDLPKGVVISDILPMPGFAPQTVDGQIVLEAMDVFCGRLA